jgi:hypothetical protein
MSDLRRTTALKQQIVSLQAENKDLRDIIASILTSTHTPTLGALLTLVEQNIGQNGFSRVAELAQVLRGNQATVDEVMSCQPWEHVQLGGHPETKFYNILV